MDASSGYASWPMQPNSNPELAWQLGNDSVPQPSASDTMQSMHAPYSSSTSLPPTLFPAFLGGEHQMMHQQQQQYQQHDPYAQFHNTTAQTPAAGTNAFQPGTMSIDAATFHALQARFPHASPEMLLNAVLQPPVSGLNATQQTSHTQQQSLAHHQQMQAQLQHQPPATDNAPQNAPLAQGPSSLTPTSTYHNLYGNNSEHSLANALAFSSPSFLPAQPSTTPHELIQATGPVGQISALPSSVPASSLPPPHGNSKSVGGDSKSKQTLRQSKLTFLPGVAQTVSAKPVQPPPPAPASGTNNHATVSPEDGSEPSTPPLPPAKVLATKPSAPGSTSSVSTKPSAAKATSMDSVLWDKAKQRLSRLSVEREPSKAAHELVKVLSDLDSEGRFRKPVATGVEVRKAIIETLNAIATLEKGRGFTEQGRKKFFSALIAIPAARHILSSWLRQTVPPKKVTEGVADLSRRYKDTLLPLLRILESVEMRQAYLIDDAGLGKAITGVCLRAVDPSARKLALNVKEKWTKVIKEEDSTATSSSKLASASAGTASTASTVTAKRKPTESSAALESSSKRYKPAAPVTASSAGTRTTKTTPASSTNATPKPGLSFFGTGIGKKPTTAVAAPSNTAVGVSSSNRSSSASAGGAGRMNAHQSVMSFMDKLSGTKASENATVAQGEAGSLSPTTQKRVKAKKRVTWKDDDELVAVKLIEPADYGQDEDADADSEPAQSMVGAEHDEGLALRLTVSTMEPETEWYEPCGVTVADTDSGSVGSESIEGPFQTQRHANIEEVTYEEGQEPACPDESQLDQPGLTSEVPEELRRGESVEIPTPWMAEETAHLEPQYTLDDLEDTQGKGYEGAGIKAEPLSAAAAISAAPAMPGLSALLSNVSQAINGVNGVASSAAAGEPSTAATVPAPAAPLKFDVSQLQSILDAAKGNGASSNAVNAAMASENVSSANLSTLLSNLRPSVTGVQTGAAKGSTGNEGTYWQHSYGNQEAAGQKVEESYPGEYNQDYMQGGDHRYQPTLQYGQPAQRYGQTSHQESRPSYRYGSQQGDGRGNDAQNGGWQTGGWQSQQQQQQQQQHTGGLWQSKLHTKPCKFFAMGTCRYGDACNFRHG